MIFFQTKLQTLQLSKDLIQIFAQKLNELAGPGVHDEVAEYLTQNEKSRQVRLNIRKRKNQELLAEKKSKEETESCKQERMTPKVLRYNESKQLEQQQKQRRKVTQVAWRSSIDSDCGSDDDARNSSFTHVNVSRQNSQNSSSTAVSTSSNDSSAYIPLYSYLDLLDS